MTRKVIDIHINGIVQGVGFRPFVARLARELGICGWVLNSTHGVDICAQGADDVLDCFVRRLASDAPPAAVIVSLEVVGSGELPDDAADAPCGFEIRASVADASRNTLVSPDIATCPECLAELFDPANRRWHYPFVNCTNCGPRFTIINDLPYDRPLTSMAPFAMCPDCAAEYACETDRRYHAQPDACFECGPMLRGGVTPFERVAHNLEESDALVEEAARRLKAGEVLGVKGLGGWHLACDATNAAAVQKLRDRKHRPTKPLAVMVATAADAARYCEVSCEEETLLESAAHPIVLLMRLRDDDAAHLAANVAGDLPEIGIMLPSTPLQHLLIRAVDIPLVMTSANRSGEPIVADDGQVESTIGDICDWYLGNNRDIVARYDDSVARVLASGSTQMVRRARGYAPTPLFVDCAQDANAARDGVAALSDSGSASAAADVATAAATGSAAPVVFAAGPEQKSTLCFLSGSRAYVSQHLGDLETAGAWQAWDEARQRYGRLFGLEPTALACDMHPEYLSSKWARAAAQDSGLPLFEVQHHHAHVAAVMGENAVDEPIIGIVMDGTGYGTDGTIWGCEIMAATRASFERCWHLPSFVLPGGAAAVRDPRRVAFALLHAAGLQDEPRFAAFLEALSGRALLEQMIAKNINCPVASSAGRLFDGMAALMGLVGQAGYDGEAACLLEARAVQELMADDAVLAACRSTLPVPHMADDAALLRWLLVADDDAPPTASGLHARLAAVIIGKCREVSRQSGITKVALGGGCMANRLLLGLLEQGLADAGLDVYKNRELPPNDGCIAYGQAVVAAARLMEV